MNESRKAVIFQGREKKNKHRVGIGKLVVWLVGDKGGSCYVTDSEKERSSKGMPFIAGKCFGDKKHSKSLTARKTLINLM